MELPSSINTDQGKTAGPLSDDPLSCSISKDSLIVVTHLLNEYSEDEYFVCVYSAHTGLTYIGKAASEHS